MIGDIFKIETANVIYLIVVDFWIIWVRNHISANREFNREQLFAFVYIYDILYSLQTPALVQLATKTSEQALSQQHW